MLWITWCIRGMPIKFLCDANISFERERWFSYLSTIKFVTSSFHMYHAVFHIIIIWVYISRIDHSSVNMDMLDKHHRWSTFYQPIGQSTVNDYSMSSEFVPGNCKLNCKLRISVNFDKRIGITDKLTRDVCIGPRCPSRHCIYGNMGNVSLSQQ